MALPPEQASELLLIARQHVMQFASPSLDADIMAEAIEKTESLDPNFLLRFYLAEVSAYVRLHSAETADKDSWNLGRVLGAEIQVSVAMTSDQARLQPRFVPLVDILPSERERVGFERRIEFLLRCVEEDRFIDEGSEPPPPPKRRRR